MFSVTGVLLLIAVTSYVVYDNRHFRIVEQVVEIDGLPASFDGFRILQVSDLHGRYFGKNQADLIAAINSLPHDMIAFTGDMDASLPFTIRGKESQPVLDLIDGLQDKNDLFWVDGNIGPYALDNQNNPTKIGLILEAKGVKLVNREYTIKRGDDSIWIVPNLPNQQLPPDGIKIMLIHKPLPEGRSASADLSFDLALAGHYHAGQLRLPWIGALFIPAHTGLFGTGLFPPQSEVKGLGVAGSGYQYISAGLGASGNNPLLRFRLFNPPEINLIILKSGN